MIKYKYYTSKGDQVIEFTQLYKEVPVHGKTLNVSIREDGTIWGVNSKYYHCLDLDVVPTITPAEAAAVVMQDLGISKLVNVKTKLDPFGGPATYLPYNLAIIVPQKEVLPVIPELIIYPINGGDVYLCWELTFNIEEPYGPEGGHNYYIDAHTGKIIKHLDQPYSSTSSSNISSNSASYDFSSSLTSGNNIGWLPGNSFNSIPNYKTSYASIFTSYSNSFASPFFSNSILSQGDYYNNSFSTFGNLFQSTLSYSTRSWESYSNYIKGGT